MIVEKIEILEKNIDRMIKIINDLIKENRKLNEQIEVLKEREKTLLIKLNENRENKKLKEELVKKLSRISRIIEKEIGE